MSTWIDYLFSVLHPIYAFNILTGIDIWSRRRSCVEGFRFRKGEFEPLVNLMNITWCPRCGSQQVTIYEDDTSAPGIVPNNADDRAPFSPKVVLFFSLFDLIRPNIFFFLFPFLSFLCSLIFAFIHFTSSIPCHSFMDSLFDSFIFHSLISLLSHRFIGFFIISIFINSFCLLIIFSSVVNFVSVILILIHASYLLCTSSSTLYLLSSHFLCIYRLFGGWDNWVIFSQIATVLVRVQAQFRKISIQTIKCYELNKQKNDT